MKDDSHARLAAKAHTDLNIFHAVKEMLEGGHLYLPESQEAARKIVRLCEKESSHLFDIYEDELHQAERKADD